LTLSSGVLNTGTNLINVTATGAAAVSGGSSSYVNGALQKAFGTAGNPQSFTFPIGDASNYAPITLTSLNVTTAGSLTAKTAAGEPAIDHYVVVAASPQTAGTAFNTTVTAQDIFNQTVPDSTTIVTLSSSTGNAQFDSNGDSTFGDNTKTLSNGAFTISTKDVV